MTILLEATAAVESAPYVFSLGTVGVVGFMAAVTIGSIAWYNSKRPAGWEGKERPNIVPNVEK
ncbi:MAG: photosystem II assembly protein Psb35 [Phormidesmis sp.]